MASSHTERIQDYPVFTNVMTDITGKHRITSEDPRWIQFFTMNILSDLIAHPTLLTDYCHRWALNNPITKNFHQFLEQMNSRLKYLSKRRVHANNSQQHMSNSLVGQECCSGLYIGTIFLQYLLSNYDIREVKDHLGLPATWPPDESEFKNMIMNKTNDLNNSTTNTSFSTISVESMFLFEIFLDEVITVLDSNNTDLYDVKFFAVECLIVLLSSSMYKTQFPLANNLPHYHPDYHREHLQTEQISKDIFSQYLYRKSIAEMKISFSLPNDSVFFSKIISVRLIKSLVIMSLSYDQRQLNAEQFLTSEQSLGMLLPKIYQKLLEEHLNYLQEVQSLSVAAAAAAATKHVPNYSSSLTSENTYGNVVYAVRQIILGMLKRIPVPMIQQWIPDDAVIEFSPHNHANQEHRQITLPSTPTHSSESSVDGSSFFYEVKDIQSVPQYLVRERSCQLLLLLLHQRKSTSSATFNPFRQAFNLLVDEELEANGAEDENDLEMMNSKSYSSALSVLKIHVEFHHILEMLIKLLPNHNFSLLLYSFLQIHSTFPESLRATGLASSIIMKCLEGLYLSCQEMNEIVKASEAVPSSERMKTLHSIDTMERVNDIYLFVINLLIILQDSTLVESILSETIIVPGWFKGRAEMKTTIIDFIILTILKCLCFAACRLQDYYIISTIHAIFMNLVKKIVDIQSYTSERIMKMIVLFAKKIFKTFQQINSWNQNSTHSFDGDRSFEDASPGSLSRVHSNSFDSLLDIHETANSISRSDSHSIGRRTNLQTVYIELAVYKLVLSNLLQFSAILIRSRLQENTNFLYAIILQYELLTKYLLDKSVDSYIHDKITEEPQSTSPNSVESQPMQYSHYLLSLGRHYLQKVEAARAAKNISYFTAKEAMKYLVEEIIHVKDKTVGDDIEGNVPAIEDEVQIQYDEESIRIAVHEFHKSKYLYEEAENPDEFFLPYIWTNIILTTPELIWKLPNIHHFSNLYA